MSQLRVGWTVKKIATVVVGATLAVVPLGCAGSDDDAGDPQTELAALLNEDAPAGVDAGCISEKTAELSDEAAQFLIDNFEAESADGFSADLQTWIAGLDECVDLATLEE